MSLADILSLRDGGLSEQEAWAVCLECSLSVRSVARSAIFQTLCITPDTLAFNTSGNVCFMELLSGEARARRAGGRGHRPAADSGRSEPKRSQSPGFRGDPVALGEHEVGAALGLGRWRVLVSAALTGPGGATGPPSPFLPFGVHSHTAAVAEAPLLTMAPPSPKMALWVLSRAGGPPLGVQGRECPPLAGPHGP